MDIVTRRRGFRRTVPAALAEPAKVLKPRKGPGKVRPRHRRRRASFQVGAGRAERVDRHPKRRAVQRGLLETRVR